MSATQTLREALSTAVKRLCPCQPVRLDGQTWFKFSCAEHFCGEAGPLWSFVICEFTLEIGLTVLSADTLQDISH